ncbi:MAG: GntR family transcriptional regulator [Alphaproteobacteria bacterium]|nr:GntR family transcriptional regulator [Alphaproteobacteria bacterium]
MTESRFLDFRSTVPINSDNYISSSVLKDEAVMLEVRNEFPITEDDVDLTAYSKLTNALCQDIQAGRFAADARLKVRDLAARYGVSPSPVREALQVLNGLGLVEIDPNKGARVRHLTPAAVDQVCQINQALESFAARVLAESVSPHQIRVLREIDARHQRAYRDGNIDGLADAGRDFHFTIYRFIRNPFVTRTAIIHTTLAFVNRREVGFSRSRLDAICSEHTEILDAIEARDPERAARLAFEHARSCTDDLVDRVTRRIPPGLRAES